MNQEIHLAPGLEAADGLANEALLVARLRAGEPAACRSLIESAGARMLAIARRLLASEAAAQQAVKDAFVSVFLALDGFDGEMPVATWLERSVVNACLIELRSRPRAGGRTLDDLLPSFLPDGHQAAPARAWKQVSPEAMRALTRRLIDELPPAHGEVLLLRDLAQLDAEETAAILGIDAATVGTRLHHARQALRTLLDPHLALSDG